MKLHKRLFCLILAVVCLAFTVLPVSANNGNSLSIFYESGDTPLVGAPFSLYLVAWKDADGRLIVGEDFAKYHVNITDDPSVWPMLASTLAAYASFGQIEPVKRGVTDIEGMLRFSGLEDGIYLVVGELHHQNGKYYTSEPALVELPGRSAATGAIQRNVTISPKAEWVPDGGGDEWEEETIKVLKVWADGNAPDRPTSVTVHLLQDGRIYDTVTLGEEDRWSYTWHGLPTGHNYAVVEDVPNGYTVTVKRQGITFVVTNTAVGGEEPVDPELPEDSDETIPETGQPWAYVLVLTAAGLLFLVVGLYIRRGKDHEA